MVRVSGMVRAREGTAERRATGRGAFILFSGWGWGDGGEYSVVVERDRQLGLHTLRGSGGVCGEI